MDPKSTGAILESRSFADPRLKLFLEANLKKEFPLWPLKSLDFETLTLTAFFYHPSLEVARAQWQTALGGRKTASGRPNPTVGVVPGYNFSATPGATPWLPSLTFDIPIETSGKRGYRQERARLLSESARMNIAATAWQIRANLRASLIDLLAAQQRESLLKSQASLQDRIVRSLEQRVEAGANARAELVPARLARARLQIDLAEGRRLNAEAKARLAEATGVPMTAFEGVGLSYDPSEQPPIGKEILTLEARGLALRSRADVGAALAEYAATQSALQMEVAKQYPDFHLGPGYQYDQGDHKFTFSATLELPLFNQNHGPIAEAQARRAEAAARVIALQSRIVADMDRAASSVRVTQENLTALEAFAATQREQSEAIIGQVGAGAADPLDLLNSQLELGLSELARADGRAKADHALGALEDVLQIPVGTLSPASLERDPMQTFQENRP